MNSVTTTRSGNQSSPSAAADDRRRAWLAVLDNRDPRSVADGELVPAQFCREVLARPGPQDEPPCGAERGKVIAEELIDSFPPRKGERTSARYAASLAVAFGAYPERVARAALRQMQRSATWFPTGGEVTAACDAIVGLIYRRRTAARLHLRRREQLDRERQHAASVAADRQDTERRARLLQELDETLRKIGAENRIGEA